MPSDKQKKKEEKEEENTETELVDLLDDSTHHHDPSDLPNNIEYNKNLTFPQLNLGSKTIIPYSLFDELGTSLRYSGFVAAFTGLYLFNLDWASEALPLVFLALNIVTILSRFPFLGGYVSNSLSMLLGGLFATALLIAITYIVGHESEIVTYPSPTPSHYVCVYNPLNGTTTAEAVYDQLQGTQGDPNTILFAFLLFLSTFLILQLGGSFLWRRGAVVVLNIFGAIWYLAMKDPATPIPSDLDFFRYLRTMMLGMGFYLICLLLPLPSPFRGEYFPKAAISTETMMAGMKGAQGGFASLCSMLVTHYRHLMIDPSIGDKRYDEKMKKKYQAYTRHQAIASVSFSSKLFLREKLDALQDLILKMKAIYTQSAQWEAFWWTLPKPHCIGGAEMQLYLAKFNLLVIHAKMMVRALDDLHFLLDSDVFISIENAEQVDQLMLLSDQYISQSFTRHQNFAQCCSPGNPCGCAQLPLHGDDLDDLHGDLTRSMEKLLHEQTAISYDAIIDQISESNLTFDRAHIASSLPSQFPRLFFVYNFLMILKLTRELELICRHLPSDSEISPSPRWVNLWERIIEYPVRLSHWLTAYPYTEWGNVKELVRVMTCRSRYPGTKFAVYWINQSKNVLCNVLVSGAISVAFLFLFISHFRESISSVITIIITIVIAVEPQNPGTAMGRSIYRLAGTAVGVALSFLVLALFFQSLLAVYIASILFAFIGRFLMSKERYADFASSFLTTSFIAFYSGVLLAPPNLLLPTVASRGIAVGIGIVIAFAALLLWPINPNLQLRYNVLKLLLVDSSHALKRVFSSHRQNRLEPTEFYAGWVKRVDKRIADIALQSELCIESREEFHLFSAYYFPFQDFNEFIRIERRLCGDVLWLELILYYIRRDNVKLAEISPEFSRARTQLYSTMRFCLGEIGRKIYTEHHSPFLVHYHLKKAFYEYAEQLRFHMHKLEGKSEGIQIIRFYALIYTFSILLDTIAKLDRKAERIASANIARKQPGFTLPW